MPFLEVGGFRGTLVILEHAAALYRYSPILEMYSMGDERFIDFSTYLDLHTFITVFNENFEKALESGEPIITMPYTPIMAKVLRVCLHKYFTNCLDNWLCVSFFHNDEDTAQITLDTGDSPLEYKNGLLDELHCFPYIKTIEIPRNLLLTYPALYQLIESII
jgi:hypothetical protein